MIDPTYEIYNTDCVTGMAAHLEPESVHHCVTMEQKNADLRARLAEAEARVRELEGDAAYWQRIADYHYAKRQAAEARASRWARYGLAYQVALQFEPEDETDDAMCAAQEVEDAWRDLTEHGDLPVEEDEAKKPGNTGDLV